VIGVAPPVGRRGLAGRELTREERVHMPFPPIVVPPVESGCRLQLRVLLHTDLSKECGCASPEELNKFISSTAHLHV
jgi:hypothetical protein